MECRNRTVKSGSDYVYIHMVSHLTKRGVVKVVIKGKREEIK